LTFELLQTLPAACLDEVRFRAEQHHIDRLRSWDPAHGFNMDPADYSAASFGCKEAYLWDRRRAIAQMAELTKARKADCAWIARMAELTKTKEYAREVKRRAALARKAGDMAARSPKHVSNRGKAGSSP
jgi:hypothetical protein